MVESLQSVEVWGGIECTINRVNNRFIDQLEYSGHYTREDDLNLIAELGIKKIRYPVIWEKHQPDRDSIINWTQTEKRLNKLRELGITPIAGLVHHGSGPKYAAIDTATFAPGLASYASKVAEKFPWIEYYTPVNEPLTTARFCGLYGHWYPHYSDNSSFLRLLINECKATVMAMQAIRKINPAAKLLQTEDLSKTYSTPLLKYQADFENKRRWLGFDLMAGRVNEEHSLWSYLMWSGIAPEELDFFKENHCRPDIIGFNYYPTSERFLDENLEKYPAESHGGNHRHRYADVEAVRVDIDEDWGAKLLLTEAWERFRTPMVVSEVHLGCTRDEQLRWLKEMYSTASELRKNGIDIRAITAWAMLGSYGWNKLLTSNEIRYEPGIFDLSAGTPRPTALARLVKGLAAGQTYRHPVLEGKGWWKKDLRILYFQNNIRRITKENKTSRPILILGKTGTLGTAFGKLCQLRGLEYELLGRESFNLSNTRQLEELISKKRPWAIVNAAGYVRVDEAELASNDCYIANAYGPAGLGILARKHDFKLLTFSSDLVFDGVKNAAYTEKDPVSPLNVYGRSKALAEKLLSEIDTSALIIRTSAFFGPWDNYNFVTNALSALQDKSPFPAAKDLFISPTYVPDLVNASLDLLLDDECGIWHLANSGETTWARLAVQVAKQANCDPELVIPVPAETLGFKAPRPTYSVLTSEKGLLLPSLHDALSRYIKEQELLDLSLAVSETA